MKCCKVAVPVWGCLDPDPFLSSSKSWPHLQRCFCTSLWPSLRIVDLTSEGGAGTFLTWNPSADTTWRTNFSTWAVRLGWNVLSLCSFAAQCRMADGFKAKHSTKGIFFQKGLPVCNASFVAQFGRKSLLLRVTRGCKPSVNTTQRDRFTNTQCGGRCE